MTKNNKKTEEAREEKEGQGKRQGRRNKRKTQGQRRRRKRQWKGNAGPEGGCYICEGEDYAS